MAARLNKLHSDDVRKRIQASNIIDRLQKNALGTLKSPQGESIQMSVGQIKSAEIILDRSVPKLQQIQHTGKDGGPIVITQVDADL